MSTVSEAQKQTVKLNETNQSQIQTEKIITHRNEIPVFTKQVQEDGQNDKLAYVDPIQMNMLRRLHVRSQFPEMEQHEKNEYFLKRLTILNSIFPFYQQYNYKFENDNQPGDEELVYDIEKLDLKEYIKRLYLPGPTADEDMFPKMVIGFYVFVLLSWFIVDVLIYKVFYSADEIMGNNADKKFIKTQLKGMEYKMELKESPNKFPRLEQELDYRLDSILHEVKKQSTTTNNNNKINGSTSTSQSS